MGFELRHTGANPPTIGRLPKCLARILLGSENLQQLSSVLLRLVRVGRTTERQHRLHRERGHRDKVDLLVLR